MCTQKQLCFNKYSKTHIGEKAFPTNSTGESLSNVGERINEQQTRNHPDPSLLFCKKLSSKYIKDLTVRPKTKNFKVKTFQVTHRNKDFPTWTIIASHTIIYLTQRQIGLYEIKNLLHIKREILCKRKIKVYRKRENSYQYVRHEYLVTPHNLKIQTQK